MQQTEETPRRQPSRTRRLASSWYLPATVFALSCAMIFGVYGYILHQSEVAWRSEVSRDAALITAEVRDRLRTHAQFLRSVRAFFTASDTVTPAEWSRFSQQLQIERNIPGIQIYGYAAVVDGNGLATFVSERRRIAPPPGGDAAVFRVAAGQDSGGGSPPHSHRPRNASESQGDRLQPSFGSATERGDRTGARSRRRRTQPSHRTDHRGPVWRASAWAADGAAGLPPGHANGHGG